MSTLDPWRLVYEMSDDQRAQVRRAIEVLPSRAEVDRWQADKERRRQQRDHPKRDDQATVDLSAIIEEVIEGPGRQISHSPKWRSNWNYTTRPLCAGFGLLAMIGLRPWFLKIASPPASGQALDHDRSSRGRSGRGPAPPGICVRPFASCSQTRFG